MKYINIDHIIIQLYGRFYSIKRMNNYHLAHEIYIHSNNNAGKAI